MNKIYEKLYNDYYKANKTYKLSLLKKYGFATEQEFFDTIGHVPKVKAEPKIKEDAPPSKIAVDYVIAFDTTGSMSSYIGSVKKYVKKLIPTLFKDTPNLKLKIVAFGDYCDMQDFKNNIFGKAYQDSGLIDDQNMLISFIDRAQNTSGGDSNEFYELVIKKITEETQWRKGSRRNVLLIADNNPHSKDYYYSDQKFTIDWKKEAESSAKLGIQWDTLKIIPRNTWYNELSQLTGGICADFKNSDKISQVIEAASAVRYNKEKFASAFATALNSGDIELIGAYKSFSKLL